MAGLRAVLALLLIFIFSTVTVADVAACCQVLASRFEAEQVFAHDDPGYTPQNSRWTLNAQLSPTCIFKPYSSGDVAYAVKVFTAEDCAFAIKSGGHTPWAGANNINEGITVDLSFLNATTLSADRTFVSLGAGGTWGNAYTALNGTGIAFPGGRVKSVGIGGLTLGGGYSWLTPKVGWVADNVLNYEIVLGSGEIKNVNQSSDGGLFLALKGGGNNFGIVTRFDIAAVEHDQKIWGGFVSMSTNATVDNLQAFQDFMEDAGRGLDDTSLVALEFVLGPNDSEGQILNWITSTGPIQQDSALWSYDPLFSGAQLLNNTGWTTFADFSNNIPPVSRVTFATTTFQPAYIASVPVIHQIHQITQDVYNNFSHIPNFTWDVQYEPLPRVYLDRRAMRGGNVMGLDYTDKDLVIAFLMPLWEDAQFDDEVDRAIHTWLDRVHEFINIHDVGYPFEYLNYAAPFQEPFASYGSKSLRFLKDVSKRYDPEQVFQRLVPGGFKLN
ncbi:Putative FAD-binding domain, PCMH-type, FAD-binding, type PCMH, subdomain 2 [Septoria linicola]|uniref:FAD-binding domain, PCMH-type, FAD-binding, type PCMH, subdomain 2 n=1 Tax=Septoria linicola TaxID=215465 RepID=A0A9Q9B1C6_9PEZI|nr:putative FAD-binding domain, PCMH-type, FAD-binding, type PCMH, subdomain 2 [Septoria linicola]USW55768.1 Putative FAD-binding domain, PCMH-type, FAD-binding, type PCMH, subdomain 2 [Septoria linicola]